MRTKLWIVLCAGLLTLAGCSKTQTAAVDPANGVVSETDSGTAVGPTPIDIPAGTRVRVRLLETLDTKATRTGDHFSASLDQPVLVNDKVVVPQGTTFHGHVTESKRSGRFKGRAALALKLDSFDLNGQSYQVASTGTARVSKGHKKHNLLWIGGGSGGGAAIGAIAGGGTGALIGAGAGAAAGTLGSAITGQRNIHLAAESALTFTLHDAVSVRS